MVKGKTTSGIEFELDERIKDDARFMHLLVRMQKASDPIETAEGMNELLSLIFGSDENTYSFMNEVAAKHDGICSAKNMLVELTEMLNALNAKN